MCSADSARICASGHGHPLASPRRRVAHYHDEGVQQQERYSIEEQARDSVRDRRAVATDEIPPLPQAQSGSRTLNGLPSGTWLPQVTSAPLLER